MTETQRLAAANEALRAFQPCAKIEPRKGGTYVVMNLCGKVLVRRWQCRGQDFYPVWNRLWPGGGTSVTALSQLVRWVRGLPVLPLSSWRWWASDTVQLLDIAAVESLAAAGYPERARCVLCGEEIVGRLDWWSLDGVSGPCCGWTTGCRQRTAP